MGLSRYIKRTYSKQDEDELQNDFKYLVYYILSWIAYIDNHYKMH